MGVSIKNAAAYYLLEELIKMSECDKVKIVGYVEQSPAQIETINHLKTQEIEIVGFFNALINDNVDKRWTSVAKTHIQQGFMAAVRAVARPNGD